MDSVKPYDEVMAQNDAFIQPQNNELTQKNIHQNQSLQENSLKDEQLIGDLLVRLGKMKPQDVERILTTQLDKNLAFGEAAKRLGLISEQDIQQALAHQFDYPYLHKSNELASGKKFSQALFAAYAPFSDKGEILRDLRSQLLMRWFDKGNKTLAITSVNASDKSCELAANLAIIFSQLGKKTLLVDANLRQPKQHQLFNLDNKLGLSNKLINRATTDSIVQIAELSNLSVLTAGSLAPNPTELLERANFAALLDELSEIYEIVIVDTAPFSVGSDAITVAMRAKGMLPTVTKDASRLEDVQLFIKQSKIAGIETVGFVLQDK